MLSTKKIYQIFLALVVIWCFLIIIATIFDNMLAYDFFSRICHQKPDRTISILGKKMPVCARCFGIYSGFLLGTSLYPFLKEPPKKWLLILAIPLALDGITQLAGLRESNNTLRLATGIMLGSVLPFYIIPGLIDFVEKYINRRSPGEKR